MAQIHSYLVINAKSELKYLNEEITSEDLDETFNQIALSMASGSDLFDSNDNDDDNEIDEIDFTPENYEFDNEVIDLEGINNNSLDINNFIDLSASILNTDLNNEENEALAEVSINHGDTDFDIDEMISRFSITES